MRKKTGNSQFMEELGELKPREMLERAASMAEVPADSLLAVVLRTGAPGCNVLELARRLIAAYGGSIGALAEADWRSLRESVSRYNRDHPESPILGMGKVKMLELSAAFELARRGIRHSEGAWKDLQIRANTARAAAELFRPLVVGEAQENFFVLPVGPNCRPMCEPIRLTRGTVDSTPVHPREVFREAIRWGAHSIIVAHNHPSGDPTPSEEDYELTRRLLEVARLHAIPLLDHLVLGAPGSAGGLGYVSIRQTGIVAF